MSTPQNEGHLESRLTKLELLFMHLERQVAQLNQIVLDQGQQLERLQRELRRLRDEEAQSANEPIDDQPDEGAAWS